MSRRRKVEAVGECKSAIVGLGNPILTDDAVGIVVARFVHLHLPDNLHVDLIEAALGGFDLAEMLVGYDKAVIVDATPDQGGGVGAYHLVDLAAAPSPRQPAMTHQVGLIEGLELARRLNMKPPGDVRIYAVEVADTCTFGTRLTDAVQAAVPRIAAAILSAEFGVEGSL